MGTLLFHNVEEKSQSNVFHNLLSSVIHVFPVTVVNNQQTFCYNNK